MNDWRDFQYLEHHGVEGQKWGQRNGPPYPLSSDVSTGKRLLKKAGEIYRDRKEKKRIKRENEIAEQKRKAAEEEEAAKQAIIKSGNMQMVSAAQSKLSMAEFKEAVERCELNKRLSSTEITKTDFDRAVAKVKKGANAAKTGIDAWNTFAQIYNTLNEEPVIKIDGTFWKNQNKKDNEKEDKKKKDKKAEHSAIDTFNDAYLEHRGILGMKWGQRNGPPYPLGAGDHSASEKKAGWRKSLKEAKNNDRETVKDSSSKKMLKKKSSTSNKQLTEDSFKPYKGYDDYMVYNTKLKDSSGKELDVMLSYLTGNERDNSLMITNLNKAVKSFNKINNDAKQAVENYNGLKDWGIKSSDLSMPRVHADPWEDSIVLTYYDKKTGHDVDIEYDLKNKKVTGYGVNG